MKTYRGMELTPTYGMEYFWCYPDFDGGDIDWETPTQDPHGTGTIDQCHDQIDEHLAELEFDITGDKP